MCIITDSPTHAKLDKTFQEDVITNISKKLVQIENQLKESRVSIASAKIQWKEIEDFQTELMFAVAHDPYGPAGKETPPELSPSYLTIKLKRSWEVLQKNVQEMGHLSQTEEWLALQADVQKFFDERDQLLYQSARSLIKSGRLNARIEKVVEIAKVMLKESSIKTNVSVKILDPVIDKMTTELATLNQSVIHLNALITPPPPEDPSVFREKYYSQLALLGGGTFLAGLLITLLFFTIKTKLAQKKANQKPEIEPNSFNYYEWLKRLEASLQSLKANEENTVEKYIHLKNYASEMNEARRGLCTADNQHDYDKFLDQLNATAHKLEDYFHQVNLKKNSESSRKLITLVVQLCDAIESNKVMSFNSEKPHLRVIKQEQAIQLNVA